MIITFRSKAAGEVIMLGQHDAQRVQDIGGARLVILAAMRIDGEQNGLIQRAWCAVGVQNPLVLQAIRSSGWCRAIHVS